MKSSKNVVRTVKSAAEQVASRRKNAKAAYKGQAASAARKAARKYVNPCRKGSVSFGINNVIAAGVADVKEIAAKTKLSVTRVGHHVRYWVARGHLVANSRGVKIAA